MQTYESTRVYKIDLDADPSERWNEVIQKEKRVMETLIDEGVEDLPLIGIGSLIASVFSKVLIGSDYYKEIRSWARAMGESVGLFSLLNHTYEMSHVGEFSIYGCTAGVKWIEGVGNVHVRNMDWPLESLGKATRIFEFQRGGKTKFISVGLPGMSGVMSGMVPGKFSITLNWAPPNGWIPNVFGTSPTFLIREVLDECDSFSEAVRVLSETELSAPAFFTVCGVEEGEACVVERIKYEYVVRWICDEEEEILTQANHHVHADFEEQNDELDYLVDEDDDDSETMLEDSTERDETLWGSLYELTETNNLSEIGAVLDDEPVFNDYSFQQMVFHPKSGKYIVWRNRH